MNEYVYIAVSYTIILDDMRFRILKLGEDKFLVITEETLDTQVLDEKTLCSTFRTMDKHSIKKL